MHYSNKLGGYSNCDECIMESGERYNYFTQFVEWAIRECDLYNIAFESWGCQADVSLCVLTCFAAIGT